MRESILDKAENLLSLAATYAADGAIQTAIDRANEAIAVLQREQKRRAKLMREAGDAAAAGIAEAFRKIGKGGPRP